MAEHLQTPPQAQGLSTPEALNDAPRAGASASASQAGLKKTGGRPKSFVWQYYTQISDANNRSKRCKVLCRACGSDFLSRVDQMEAHLAYHCEKTDPEIAELMRERIETAKANAKLKREAQLREAALAAAASTVRAATPIAAPLPVAKRQKIEAPLPAEASAIPIRLRYPQVCLPPHPLIQHWLAVCRNKTSPSPIFRSAIAELGRLLIYEAAEDWLPSTGGQVDAPFGIAECQFVDPNKPVKVVPILRAGLVLLETAATVLPSCETYHVAQVRDEITMQENMYLNKLPLHFATDDRVLVCDPMIGTGQTVLNVLNELTSRGGSQEYLRVVCVLITPPALELITKEYPGTRIFAAHVDPGLSESGFIVPGLGDAGDRCFGTL